MKRDGERTLFLESEGYEILRFWNNDVNGNLVGVFLKIQERLREIDPHPNPLPEGEGGKKKASFGIRRDEGCVLTGKFSNL